MVPRGTDGAEIPRCGADGTGAEYERWISGNGVTRGAAPGFRFGLPADDPIAGFEYLGAPLVVGATGVAFCGSDREGAGSRVAWLARGTVADSRATGAVTFGWAAAGADGA